MLKVSLTLGLFLFMPPRGIAQTTVAQKMEEACAGVCHGTNLIAQQRLDRAGWSRELDKMVRWGAQVAEVERDAIIDYLTELFNWSRPRPNTSKVISEGKGKDVFQISCMSCHDDTLISGMNLSRTGWSREVEKMMNWGAYVPSNRKEELIEYLTRNFSR